jgi:hypothetical protein
MTNDAPDDRSLAVYRARATLHASRLAWSEKALLSLSNLDNEERKVRFLISREHARRSLRVMELLTAAWHRDHRERREWRGRAEQAIRHRYSNLAARYKQQ